VRINFSCVLAAVLGFGQGAFAADSFPSKPITFIVPFAPGADTDTSARLLAKHAEPFLGQPVLVLNKGGASGMIGASEGLSAPADGYMLVVASPSFLVAPLTIKGAKRWVQESEAVYLPVGSPSVLVMRSEGPWKSFGDLISHAKSNPDQVKISNTGNLGLTHLLALGIEVAAGVKFNHIPFKGSGPAMVSVLGGHTDGMLATVGTVQKPVELNQLRVLAIGSEQRAKFYPNAPTFKELSINVNAQSWWGYVAPKGTPKAVIDTLAAGFAKAVASKEYQDVSTRLNWVTIGQGPQAFSKFLRDEDARWEQLIKKLTADKVIAAVK